MKIAIISFGPIESKSNGYFIRCQEIVNSLLKLGHTITVFEFIEYKPKQIYKSEKLSYIWLKGNKKYQNSFLTKYLSFDPFSQFMFQLNSFIELSKVRSLITKNDIIFIESSLIFFASILAKLKNKKVILDTHCINKLLASTYKEKNLLAYLGRNLFWDILERFASRISDKVLAVSEKEENFIQQEYGVQKSKILVLPNFIEINHKKSTEKELVDLKNKFGLEDKYVITFLGDLGSIQNKDAVEYIISDLSPYFWKKMRNVSFLIIGKKADNFNKFLPNVIFTGFIDDLSPFHDISDIYIAPLSVGAGVKTKVLEYIFYEKPLITTPLGIEGIEFEKNKNITVTEINFFKEILLKKILVIDNNKTKQIRSINQNSSNRSHKEFIQILSGALNFERI